MRKTIFQKALEEKLERLLKEAKDEFRHSHRDYSMGKIDLINQLKRDLKC